MPPKRLLQQQQQQQPQQHCASYRYVLTPQGGKFIQIADQQSKDEESPADYNPGGYLPIQLGDTFKHGRYKVVRKLGWGHFSTVWLVKDFRFNRHSAIKVVKSATRYAETALDEIKLLSQISRTRPSHPGLNHIVTFLDSFSHSPSLCVNTPTRPLSSHPLNQGHICIVFEPLGENLLGLILRHKQRGVPRALVKYVAKQVLEGLEYLHDECDLVHTDIKPENILIQIPNIESHITSELCTSPVPTSRNVDIPFPSIPNPTYPLLNRYPGAMTIPTSRASGTGRIDRETATTSRRVQIWDSQPLGSPVISSSLSSGSFPLIGAFKDGNDATNRQPHDAVAQEVRPTSPSTTISPSSSSSSLGFGSDGHKLGSSVVSTPNTSISLGIAGMGLGPGFNGHGVVCPNPVGIGRLWEVSSKGKAKDESVEEQLQLAMASQIPRPPSSSSSSSATSSLSSTPPMSSPIVHTTLKPPSTPHHHHKHLSDTPTQLKHPPNPSKHVKHASSASSITVSTIPRKPKLELFAPAPVPATVSLSNIKVNVDSDVEGIGVLQPAPMSLGPGSVCDVLQLEVEKTPPLPPPPPPTTGLLTKTFALSPTPTPPTQKRTRTRITTAEGDVLLTPGPPPPTPVELDVPEGFGPGAASPSAATTRTTSTPTPTMPCPPYSPPPLPPIQIKIADLGNATPSGKHFTEDIQTRQYRSPEAITGRRDWGCKVDIWSVGCLLFELLTAEYLFDPQGQGTLFTKDDDHMAQIIELLGDFPLELKVGGRYSRELFEPDGSMRYIKTLKPWPLQRVMVEKYGWSEPDAAELCGFLEPMLRVDWRERFGARDAIEAGGQGWLRVKKGDWGDETMVK